MTFDELLLELQELKTHYPAIGMARVIGVADVIRVEAGDVYVGVNADMPTTDDDNDDPREAA